jgi:hypothetical protein
VLRVCAFYYDDVDYDYRREEVYTGILRHYNEPNFRGGMGCKRSVGGEVRKIQILYLQRIKVIRWVLWSKLVLGA